MEKRKFAKSGDEISLLGYGCWGIGKSMWIGADDAESQKALHRAIDEGINFFDTALVYGMGHSETLVGGAEKESGKKLFIASKVPPENMQWPAADSSTLKETFSKNYIIKRTEQSLKNLKRDHIDLMQFHVWNDKWAAGDDWKEAVDKLKKDGKVRYWGISINDHQPGNGIEAGKTGLIDSFQVIFNIFDQKPADQLFPFCKKHNISIIARVPYDEGALTGSIGPDTVFHEGDFRDNYFRGDRKKEVKKRVNKIETDIKHETETLPEAALRFI